VHKIEVIFLGTFAERLSEYQKKLGFKSVAAFAKAVNIPATTLHEVLKGRTKSLSAENTQKLADYMGISVDEVLGREKEKTPDAEAPRDSKYNEIFNLFYGLSEDNISLAVKGLAYLVKIPDEKLPEAVRYLQFLADTAEN
jgi:transcriptional regulator with XRE-family HTH domain